MPLQLDIWSDYNCPWCFMASRSVEMLQQSHNVEVRWHSYELRPKGSPPIPPSYLKRIDETRPRLYQMARDQFGIEMNAGPFAIDSRPALIGAKFAQEQGKGDAYHRAVMTAYWIEARDIGDSTVLADIAAAIGLDRDDYLVSLSQRDYAVMVDTDILMAQQMALSGVPALLFERRYLVHGAQPYEELVKAIGYIREREQLA